MKTKKLITLVITVLMILATATCFAQISADEFVIDKIYLGQPWSEFINTYGQRSFESMNPNRRMAYVYNVKGGQFLVEKYNEHISFIAVPTNKFMSTKKGIRIGSTTDELLNAYGRPDNTKDVINGDIVFEYLTSDGQGILRFFINSGRVNAFNCGGDNISVSPSSRPSSQTPKGPTSTIPKAVQEMPESEFYIGGITVGQALDYVEQIYGKPGNIDDQGYIQVYNYNDLFIVRGKLNNGYRVCSVAIYEKGLTTPSGFTVDMPYAEVSKKFGVGHEVKFKGEGVEAKLKGCKDYTYFCNNKQMVFLVDKKGVIKAIRVEDRDDSKFIEVMRE